MLEAQQRRIYLWPPGEPCLARHWCPPRSHSGTARSHWSATLTKPGWRCSGWRCNQATSRGPEKPSSPAGRGGKWARKRERRTSRQLKAELTFTTLSLATRTDCSFCRPSEPLWPQTLVHLTLGTSEDELGWRVKTQGRRTVLDSSSLMVWWVTFRMFTNVSAAAESGEKRHGEDLSLQRGQRPVLLPWLLIIDPTDHY